MQENQQINDIHHTLQINITDQFQFQCLLIDSINQEKNKSNSSK